MGQSVYSKHCLDTWLTRASWVLSWGLDRCASEIYIITRTCHRLSLKHEITLLLLFWYWHCWMMQFHFRQICAPDVRYRKGTWNILDKDSSTLWNQGSERPELMQSAELFSSGITSSSIPQVLLLADVENARWQWQHSLSWSNVSLQRWRSDPWRKITQFITTLHLLRYFVLMQRFAKH